MHLRVLCLTLFLSSSILFAQKISMKSDSLHLSEHRSAALNQLNSEQLNRLPKRSIESKIDVLPGAVFQNALRQCRHSIYQEISNEGCS